MKKAKLLKEKITAMALAAGLVASPVIAAEPVHLVTVVNFDCPHCYSAQKHFPHMESVTTKTGGTFVIAPLPTEIDDDKRELFYYAADTVDKKAGKLVLRTLFDAAKNEHRFENMEEVATLLQIEYPSAGFDWLEIAEKHEEYGSKKRLAKAIALANELEMMTYPGFITYDGTNKELVITSGTIPEQVTHVIEKIRGY